MIKLLGWLSNQFIDSRGNLRNEFEAYLMLLALLFDSGVLESVI